MERSINNLATRTHTLHIYELSVYSPSPDSLFFGILGVFRFVSSIRFFLSVSEGSFMHWVADFYFHSFSFAFGSDWMLFWFRRPNSGLRFSFSFVSSVCGHVANIFVFSICFFI